MPGRRKPSTGPVRSKRFQGEARAVGSIIRARRVALGLTQEEAASLMQSDFRQVQRIEAGAANVTLDTLLRVTDALELPPGTLFARDGHPRAAETPNAAPGPFAHSVEHNIKYGHRQRTPAALFDEATVLGYLGQILRDTRKRLGLTQKQMATSTGITVQHVQRIESGRQNVTVRTLLRLARLLDVPPRDLLGDPQ